MDSRFAYLIAADAILFTHVLFVVFVIFGLLLILTGKVFSWSWVRNPWFRLVHLLGIGIVMLQSWVGAICPLTNWEMAFRSKAGDAIYAGSFLSHPPRLVARSFLADVSGPRAADCYGYSLVCNDQAGCHLTTRYISASWLPSWFLQQQQPRRKLNSIKA